MLTTHKLLELTLCLGSRGLTKHTSIIDLLLAYSNPLFAAI